MFIVDVREIMNFYFLSRKDKRKKWNRMKCSVKTKKENNRIENKIIIIIEAVNRKKKKKSVLFFLVFSVRVKFSGVAGEGRKPLE